MWFPMGLSRGAAAPGVPPHVPTHAPTQHRTRFLPHCDMPLPAACVTRRCQHKERGQPPAHARPGTHRVSIPPRLLANPARGSWGRGPTLGLHRCCQLWKIGQKLSGLGDLSASCAPQSMSCHPARARDGKGTQIRAPTPHSPNLPWHFEGGWLDFQPAEGKWDLNKPGAIPVPQRVPPIRQVEPDQDVGGLLVRSLSPARNASGWWTRAQSSISDATSATPSLSWGHCPAGCGG